MGFVKRKATPWVVHVLFIVTMTGLSAFAQQTDAAATSRPLESPVPISAVKTDGFVHPGVLFNKEDLERMQSLRDQEPWKSGFAVLASKPTAALDYKMRGPFEEVGREPNVHRSEFESDMNAVQDQALMWYFTGDRTYAQNAIRILNAWATTHKRWSGITPGLMAGDQGIAMAVGAEILRYTPSGWSDADIEKCEAYFQMVFQENISVGRAEDPVGEGNQGASHLKAMMGLAVFCNNRERFDYTVRAIKEGVCTSIQRNFLPSGQNAEAGRDQPHPLGAIGNYATALETAWKQGFDLYALEDNRLLKGIEYWTKYNLGEDVPFEPFGDCHNWWHRISDKGRGPDRSWAPVELLYQHYAIRKNLPAPYTRRYRDGLPVTEATLFFRTPETSTSSAPQTKQTP